MNTAPSSAATNASAWKWSAPSASEVPTSTGAIAAGSVRTRAAITQMRTALTRLGSPRKPREVRLALLAIGVATLLGLLVAVEEQVRVVRQLLDPRQAVFGGVEARLQQAQRKRGEREHLVAPLHRLLLQPVERHDGVDHPHFQRLLGGVLAAEKPDLLGLLRADEVGQQARAEAAVEGADLRPDLAEARVVGGDRQVAHEVQHVPAADRVAGDHRHDRLGQPADLHVQVGDVKAPDAGAGRSSIGRSVVVEVARVAAHALVAARAERVGTLAGQHDHADLRVLARVLQRARDLHDRARAKGVSHLRAGDRDLRDAVGALVADVFEGAAGVLRGICPGGAHGAKASLCGMVVEAWLARAAAARPGSVALDTPAGSATYAQLLASATAAAGDLAARGVGAGERVAIALPAGLDFAYALHACMLLGAVAVPVDLRLSAPERARVAEGAAAVVEQPLQATGETAPPPTAPMRHELDATAVVIHTSGTGSAPKPVQLTYGNLLWSALGSAVAFGLDADERWLCALPLSHVGGLSILVRSAIYATTAEPSALHS